MRDLMTEFTAQSDQARRLALAARIQERAHATVTITVAGQFTVAPAYRSDLQGMMDIATPVFWNVRRVAR